MRSGPRGRFPYDFAIYDDLGRLSALLMAKRRFGTDASSAQRWHEGVVESIERPAATRVVLVTPDRIYAWPPGADAAADPDWVLDAAPWFAPYFTRLKIPAAEVHPPIFEWIVGMWLRDVAQGELPDGMDAGSSGGLLDALQGGEVVEQVAA
jgi:hypothetical protein